MHKCQCCIALPMKWYHHLVLAIMLLVFVLWSNPLKSQWADMEKVKWLIRTVAKDYRAEQNFNWACFVWTKEVSLWALMYAMQMQEWWLREWSMWHRTNNPWSIHKPQWVKQPTGAWWESKTRPHYATLYDWMYEHAQLLAKWKYYLCKITYNSIFAYIHWPNADPNSAYPPIPSLTRSQYARKKLGEALVDALEFDRSKWEVQEILQKKEQILQEKPKERGDLIVENGDRICYRIDQTKANFVQFDYLSDGKFHDKVELPEGSIMKIYKCFYK